MLIIAGNFLRYRSTKKLNPFFTNPILSTKVGIFLVDELSESYTVIEVNDIKK